MESDSLSQLTTGLAGRYTVERELGAGGMATVYLAHDVKHDRKVAVKVLRPELAAVLGAERFLHEIRVTAKLQHPHILALFDSGQAAGFVYYVMPYLAGESLRARLIHERQLPIEETIRIANEVAEALDYAHRQGVIHRDIKPENILLHEGKALVADFGIALAVSAAGGSRLTETGLSLGTPQYMSPEQATGDRELDGRSDVYSLGAVVYEMLAGEAPHTGATAQAVLAKVITDRPRPLRQVRRRVPVWVEDAVDRALASTPADRFPTAGAFVEAARTPRRIPGAGWPPRRVMGANALVTAVIATGVVLSLRSGGETGSPADAPIPIERALTYSGAAWSVGLSPDGETVAYLTPDGLVTRDVRGGRENLVLGRWEGGIGIPESDPKWLPNGSGILFGRKMGPTEWGVWSVPRLGGDPTPVLVTQFSTGDPSADVVPFPDGERILAVHTLSDAPWLRILSPTDSAVGIAVDSSVITFWDATVSPDGRWVAYIGERGDRSAFIGTVSVDGATRHIVVDGGPELAKWDEMSSNPRWQFFRTLKWIAGDRLYYRRQSGRGMDIYVVRIDPRSGTRISEPRPVVRGLPRGSSFDISANGLRLVYGGGASRNHVHLMRLTPRGDRLDVVDSALTRGTGWNTFPRVSGDGRRIAFVSKTFETADILVETPGEAGFSRLNTLHRWRTINEMVWSPDGDRLLVRIETDGGNRLLIVTLSNARVEDLGPAPSLNTQIAWSPDGRFVAYGTRGLGGYLLKNLATGSITTLLESVGNLVHAFFSPDGRFLAAHDTNNNQVWIAPVDGGPPRSIGSIHDGPSTVESPRLIHWAPDGLLWILDPGSRTLATVPAAGGPVRQVARLPVSCAHEGWASVSLDGRLFACAVVERESDIWVIDDFDPEVAHARRRGG